MAIFGAISALLLAGNGDAPPPGVVTVHIEGMRSQKGIVRACLTRDADFFPHCDKDPASHKLNVATPAGAELRFTNVAPGDYAITVLHDENSNAKLDTMLGIPREGVGFSRNPRIVTGPPSFAAVRFTVGETSLQTTIKLKYFL